MNLSGSNLGARFVHVSVVAVAVVAVASVVTDAPQGF
jgi:hypothetical protein